MFAMVAEWRGGKDGNKMDVRCGIGVDKVDLVYSWRDVYEDY